MGSTANARQMITQIYEKLKPGGRYICISHGIPETRLNFLEVDRWSKDLKWTVQSTKLYKNKGKKSDMPFEEAEIELASVHYAFVCKKPQVEKLLQDDEDIMLDDVEGE